MILPAFELVAARSDLEQCGVVYKDGRFELRDNIHPEPRTNFRLDSRCLHWPDVAAIWHSHPEGPTFPSLADQEAQRRSALPWIITAKEGDGWTTFTFGGEPEALLGRQFRIGVTDCAQLVADAMELAGGPVIDLPPRVSIPADLEFRVRDAGLTAVEGHPQTGDVCVMQVASEHPDHIGILIDGKILHQLEDRESQLTKAEALQRLGWIKKWYRVN